MEKIFKYELAFPGEKPLRVEMPSEAEILTIQIQYGRICLWAIVDPSNENAVRFFELYGTGQSLRGKGPRKYLATLQENNGSLIWHIFEYLGI